METYCSDISTVDISNVEGQVFHSISDRQLSKLHAIEFVTRNGCARNEWVESGFYSLVCRIVSGKETDLSEGHLRSLIADIESQ